MSLLDEFYQAVFPLAKDVQTKTGVPYSIAMAQASLESANGTSGLAVEYNNFFGMKGSGSAGSVMLPTNEQDAAGNVTVTNAQFAAYRTPADSFTAYSDLMMTDRYKAVRGAKGYAEAAQALQTSGYATDKLYPKKLTDIIESNKLTGYDITFGGGGGSGLTDAQVNMMQTFLNDVKNDPNYKAKYNIKTSADYGGTNDTTVLSAGQVKEAEAAKAAADKLSLTQKIVRVLIVVVLIVVMLLMLMQAVPNPQKALLKGVTGGNE